MPPQSQGATQDASDPIHIYIRGLHKSYGEHHVLRGVDLDIARRKINVILGPSGSGKTVLMRQLIRLERPDRGQILLDGLDLAVLEGNDLQAVRSRLGMVFQMGALFDSMTVFGNVAFPLLERGHLRSEEIKDRVLELLRTLGIEGAAHKMPAEISGGMQKRVAVARALMLDAEVLIYDEPTTGLDPITTRTVDELILETRDRFGVTTLVISHDMASVQRIADNVSFLDQGRVIASGTFKEVFSSHQATTSEFLKTSGVSVVQS